MSLFGSLNSATAGLRTIQANIKLVSDNVTQADDPDRTRHVMTRTTDKTGRVQIAAYSRQTDAALRAKLEEATARNGGEAARNEYLQKINDVLGATHGKPQLSELAQKFSDAWRQLETTPESDTAQREVVQLGDRLATEIHRVSQGVEDLDREIQGKTADAVNQLNDYVSNINQINAEIVYVRSRGEPTDDLADRRDALVRQVNDLVGVRTLERGDGRISVFTTNGLALVDASPTKILYDGAKVSIANEPDTSINLQMREGRIGALLEMRADGGLADPPRPASQRPAVEIIRKLRDQLDQFAANYTAAAEPGQPASFADAYNGANTRDGELQYRFFSGNDRFSINIAHELITGTARIKQDAIDPTTAAITDSSRRFQTTGLLVSESSYAGAANGIVGLWTNAAKAVGENSELAAETQKLMETRFHNEVGVNIDEEMAHLQVLQTSYAATARVVQAVNAMFDALERAV